MLVRYGRISLFCFLFSLLSTVVLVVPHVCCEGAEVLLRTYLWGYLAGYFAVGFLLVRLLLKDYSREIGVRAFFLGTVFSLGVFLAVLSPDSACLFGWYMCILSFFHFSEFISIAASNPETLTIDSYILDHSSEYKVAAFVSWIEFWLEWWLLPGLKGIPYLSCLGLAMCLGGEFFRKAAMFTAKTSFNHIVQSERKDNHTLVTHGVYSLCRHPSYAGWFYWAIGTQVILLNPLCILAYTLASWKFFHDRIFIEEQTLIHFFMDDYIDYQDKVSTGLPLIKGFPVEDV